ncbi:AAA family ATPase [Marinicrinis sediminis]|uniref:AAA family ATPase n=1 Tax=Marinicrinis sediminis TaxID=1652465 RepID=A0ABW5RDX3_9BACL
MLKNSVDRIHSSHDDLLHHSVNAYQHIGEYIADQLQRIDLYIQKQLDLFQARQQDPAMDQWKGLIITEEEVQQLMASGNQNAFIHPLDEPIQELEQAMEKRLLASEHQHIQLPVLSLLRRMEADDVQEAALWISLAMEVDRKYEKLYAYLQDDVTCKYPTIGLVVQLMGGFVSASRLRQLFDPHHPFVEMMFAIGKEWSDASVPFLARPLRMDERMIDYCLSGEVPVSLERNGISVEFYEQINQPDTMDDVQQQIHHMALAAYKDETFPRQLYLEGEAGSGKRERVRQFCSQLGKTCVHVNLPRLVQTLLKSEESVEEIWSLCFREARLHSAVLCIERLELLFEDQPYRKQLREELLFRLKQEKTFVFLLSTESWKSTYALDPPQWLQIKLRLPNETERLEIWESAIIPYRLSSTLSIGTMASQFKLYPGQIRAALKKAEQSMTWQYPGEEQLEISSSMLVEACYAQVSHRLNEKAVRLHPNYTWEDLILPDHQKDQIYQATIHMKYRHIVYGQWGFGDKLSYGKGISILCAGPPGTGKTMSAEVIANELDLQIYKIDVSQMMSKYIGETEKNIHTIFEEAKRSQAILFFDEADTLFGKRTDVKDSHDRYANVETAYLLQKMEEYEGITILSTNLLQNIDEAFMRRIQYVVKFPFPDAAYRAQIWESMLRGKAPLHEDIDVDLLGEKFEIAGGNIKNIVLGAAFLAAATSSAISMKHLVQSARNELTKTGKIFSFDDFKEYLEERTAIREGG